MKGSASRFFENASEAERRISLPLFEKASEAERRISRPLLRRLLKWNAGSGHRRAGEKRKEQR